MKELPPDLGLLDEKELAVQTGTRDSRLASLFRRWPGLAHDELRELRSLYSERVRLARHIGELRRRRR